MSLSCSFHLAVEDCFNGGLHLIKFPNHLSLHLQTSFLNSVSPVICCCSLMDHLVCYF